MSDNKPAPVAMSDETAAVVKGALRDLHRVFHADVPAFEKCDATAYRSILGQAYNAIGDDMLARTAETTRHARAAVEAVITAKRATFAQVEAELATVSPVLRALMSEKIASLLPDNMLIGLSEVQSAFPQGTSESDMVKALHAMGFQLAKGSQAKSGIRLSIPRVAKAETPAA